MKISLDQTWWRWLITAALPFVTFVLAIACFALGYALFGVICCIWSVMGLWALVRAGNFEVFLEETGVTVMRNDSAKFIPLSSIIEIEPCGRQFSSIRITFNSEEGNLETVAFAVSLDFGFVERGVKAKEFLWDKVLQALVTK